VIDTVKFANQLEAAGRLGLGWRLPDIAPEKAVRVWLALSLASAAVELFIWLLGTKG
jgi:hypothetical protein